MTLQQIHYILKVAETGSMNRAAEVLFVSQPALTSVIKEIEDEFQIQIFRRSSRGVTLTDEGARFIARARRLYEEYELIQEEYSGDPSCKQRFGISIQHYSFAVKAFVETVKRYDTTEYAFALRETKTRNILEDVSGGRSDIGVLYESEFNARMIQKLLADKNLEFIPLIQCNPYVYLWRGHPLADRRRLRTEDLEDYPVLTFEQGDTESSYLAEEILPERNYLRRIQVSDRATIFNLMVGLNGYTFCSGIVDADLNGNDTIVIPLEEADKSGIMEIGYIIRRGSELNDIGRTYIKELNCILSGRPEIRNLYEAGYMI